MLTAAQRNEGPAFGELMAAARRARPRKGLPARVAADRAYSSDATRAWLRRRRVAAVIPHRSSEHRSGRGRFDRRAYRRRNEVERCIGRLKECRRVGTRHEKLAVNFGAMVTLAIIVQYLRLPL